VTRSLRLRSTTFVVAMLLGAPAALGQDAPAQTPPPSDATVAPPPAEAPRQNSTLSGVVIDSASKKPAADVVITLSSVAGEKTEVTDARGAYSFKDVAPGPWQMRLESPSFKPQSKVITVEAGKDITANMELLPEAITAPEIVVTGTHVPRLEVGRAAPVTVVSRQEIASSGKVTLGDILQKLPEQTGGINTQVNNGGDGSVRVDLRGFGTRRTLVLVNGRRMVAGGTGADATVDLNTIPQAAVQRIEILKDGASAIYGSDAISGVVNIITRPDFSGTEVAAYSGISGHGDGLTYDLSFTTGRVMDRGSLLFSGGYTVVQPVWAGDRAFSKYDRGIAGYDWASGQIFTGGSSATPMGRFRFPSFNPAAPTGTAEYQALRNKYPKSLGAGNWTIDPVTKEWRPFNAIGVTDAGGDFYNYQPENYLVTPMTRANVFSTGSFLLTGSTKAYYEALYTHRESSQKLAPEPLFTDQEGISVTADNAYNPYGLSFATVRRRLVEFSNRNFAQDIDTFRIVTGVKGDITKTWHWDASLNYGRTQGVNTKEGLLQRSKLASALGPSFFDADGVAHCGTPTDPIDGCVPLDLFHGAGSITPEMRKYVSYKGTARGYNQQLTLEGVTGAELFKIGNAASAAGIAAGYQHRREAGTYIPDPLTAQGDTTGNKGEETAGGYYTNEGFLEVNLPLVGHFGDFAGEGNLLEVSAATRMVSYSTFGSNLTYKAGVKLSPIKDVTLRGTWSTAFRAPAVDELYSGNADDFPNVSDPCSGPDSTTPRPQGTPVDKACDAQGVPDDVFDDRAQILARVGGNTKLQPETAQALTAGIVLEPRWVKDLSFTGDFYAITVKNSVQAVGSDVILASCYPSEDGKTAAYCDRIHRNPVDHLIRSIDDPLSNVGGDAIGGVDFALDYSPEFSFGRIGMSANLNYLAYYNRTLANGNIIPAKGTYDLTIVLPEWKGNFGVQYAREGLSAGVNVRWLGTIKECENNSCKIIDPNAKATETPPTPPRERNVGGYATADINLGYRLSYESGAATQLNVGVNNVLDRQPNYVVNGFLAASEATAYDYMGRYFFVRLSHEFQ
jgi:iron complex outermembrane recepter protein